MNTKNILGVAVLIFAALFATQMMQQDRVEAQQSNNQAQSDQSIEYARLEVNDTDQVTWRLGGVINPRTETVTTTYRRLGGQGRGTFADLLDQIGSEGWNLVQKDGNLWIFSR